MEEVLINNLSDSKDNDRNFRAVNVENVVWHTDLEDTSTIFNYAIESHTRLRGTEVVGFNDILRGDEVEYEGKKYTVVMVSRLGDFGLSETGKLPYELRVPPNLVNKIEK